MLKPLYDYVFIEEISDTNKTSTGLIKPNTNERLKRAKVIEIGEGRIEYGKLIEPVVKKDDEIIFDTAGLVIFNNNNIEYKLIRFANIVCVENE